MEFQISVVDTRNTTASSLPLPETDISVRADPRHTVADLAAALARWGAAADGAAPAADAVPGLWLGAERLNPAAALAGSGIRDGARVGLGGAVPADARRAGSGLAEVAVVAGPDAGRAIPVGPGDYQVGREAAPILLSDGKISRHQCAVSVSAGPGGLSCSLRDLGSKNGTGLDGEPVGGTPVPLRPGQLIEAGNSVLTLVRPAGGQAVVRAAGPDDPLGLRLHRPPRPGTAPPRVVVELPAEPAGHDQQRPSWLMLLGGPAVSIGAGVAISVMTGQWYLLLLGAGGVAVSLFTQLGSRRARRTRSRAEQRQFQDASRAGHARLAQALAREQQSRREAAPDPALLVAIATGPGTRLWERLPGHADFLRLRVGWADLPAATVGVHGPPGAPGAPEPAVRDVPATVDLTGAGVLGIAARGSLGQAALAWAVCQIAVLHAPSDARLVLLTMDPGAWRWTRWLPHLRPLPGSSAGAAVGTDDLTCRERVRELLELVDKRRSPAGGPHHGGQLPATPAVTVIVDDSHRAREIPGLATLLRDGPSVGVFAICRDDDRVLLPQECRAVVIADDDGHGRALLPDAPVEVDLTWLDQIAPDPALDVARALAPIRDDASGAQSGLPGSVRLLDLWGMGTPSPEQVADGWRRSGRSTAVPVGTAATGTFVLDLVRQGPHMLVAGTTNAGKSELLQALVASLALANRPDELIFVLIDYKGGATFGSSRDLPHVAGMLTDLDEHLTRRVLIALGAEVRYREQVLADAGCKDIDAYHAAREPLGALPRLVLVVDEFRFLVEEVPEFSRQIADLAARGRSLGIHLVLATQRPAGSLSESTRANIGLRVCLRVEDPGDSTAVIDVPDAVTIPRHAAGRAYARVARGAVVSFQGGYLGGRRPGLPGDSVGLQVQVCPFTSLGASPERRVPGRGAAGGEGPTDLADLVAAIRATKEEAPSHRPWLDPLPPVLRLADLPSPPAGAGSLVVGYGIEDRPAEQARRVAALDLTAGGHLLAVGGSRAGRTTWLRTVAAGIAQHCSPADVHLYVLDCDAGGLAPLAGLPHCGAVVRRTERERAGRLLDRLAAEITRRQELLAAPGSGPETGQRVVAGAPGRLPCLVLMLDRWEGFLADLGPVDSGRLVDLMHRLLTDGLGAGLRVVMTGDKTGLSRLTGYFPQRLVLRMADANDLSAAGVPKGAMPGDAGPGRAVRLPSATEVQVAVVGTGPDDAAQNAALDAIVGDAAARWGRPSPVPMRVDVLASRIGYEQALALPREPAGEGPLRPVAAAGGDEMSALTIDLARFPGFVIAGPPLSGRSNALLVLAESLLAAGAGLIVFAPRPSPVRGLAGRAGVAAVITEPVPDQVMVSRLLQAAHGPLAVLVDDAEALAHTPAADLLQEVAAGGRAYGHALVVAGTSGELARAQRGFTAAARQFRCGLLLTPEASTLGQDLFGTRLPRSAAFDGPPGRGYLIRAGRATLAQVPDAPAS